MRVMDEHEKKLLDEIRKPDVKWISMESKFGGKCIECGESINKGDQIMWTKSMGAKHVTCPTQLTEDVGGLTIIDNDNTPTTWKDPKKYSYKELQINNKCQLCGISLSQESDRYIDGDRLVCSKCFGK